MHRNLLKTMASTAALTTLFLLPVSGGPAVSAAPAAAAPTAIINSVPAAGEVLIRNGTTYVTLTDLKPMGNYKISYDNKKKQAVVQGDGRTIELTVGSTAITVDGQTLDESAAPLIHKGKVMVPLRAVAEAFGSHIVWNNAQKTAFIIKADPLVIADLLSSDLSTARNAAVHLPYASQLKLPELELTPMEMQGVDFYFPQGASDRFFIVDNDIVSYFEIRGGVKLLKWQGKLDYAAEAPENRNPFFLPAVKAEIGELPDVKNWTVAKFQFRYPVGETYYTLLDRTKEWAQGSVELDTSSPDYKGVIVDIPEE
ncbi:copper amine oxidase N-terminal domain-containing protein [Paenibacillus sp. FSL M8-0334]|nr:copper amine oxidase N-terminal domain-containing protein [Paenibacillus campinasensis]